jgi:hypothetical protein
MKTPSKFKFKRYGAGSYEVTRLEDERMIGTVWSDRLGWSNRFADAGGFTHWPSREAAARSLSMNVPVDDKKSKVWVSVVHEGRSISFIAEVLDADVAKLDPEKVFHGSCAITFEGRGIIAGHLWAVKDES